VRPYAVERTYLTTLESNKEDAVRKGVGEGGGRNLKPLPKGTGKGGRSAPRMISVAKWYGKMDAQIELRDNGDRIQELEGRGGEGGARWPRRKKKKQLSKLERTKKQGGRD